MMYHYNNMMPYSPFHAIGSVLSFVFWVIFIIFIIKLIRRHKNGNWRGMWSDRGAIGVLRERYAKGEINKEEYEERKKVLEQK